MKKVLIITPGRGIGGIEKRFATLYYYFAGLEKLPANITFLVSRAQYSELIDKYGVAINNPQLKIIKYGFPYLKSNANKAIPLLYIDLLFFVLKNIVFYSWQKFHAIHYTKASPLIIRKLLSAVKNVYSLVDSTMDVVKDPKTGDLIRKIFGENYIIDCLSDDIKKLALKEPNAVASNMYITPCSFIDYSKTEILPKEKTVVFLGRFEYMKGLNILLPSLKELIKSEPDLQFKILGYGSMEKEVNEHILKNKLTNNVSVYFANDTAKELKTSLIFLSLQKYDNYPSQSLIEAMACGNAVIVTDVGQTRRIVNEEVGILIKPEPDELVLAIKTLLSDIEKTKQMGQKAREKVMREHIIERFAEYLFGLYDVKF